MTAAGMIATIAMLKCADVLQGLDENGNEEREIRITQSAVTDELREGPDAPLDLSILPRPGANAR